MNSKPIIFFIVMISSIILSFEIHAEKNQTMENKEKMPETGTVHILITVDDTKNIGKIIRTGKDEIEFQTDFGTLTIPKNKIRSLKEIPEVFLRNGKYWFPDPNSTRLYFAPTGRMLPKGSGYFADYYLFFPTVNIGVSDRISLGGGFSLLPTNNLKDQLYFFTPKIGLKKTKKLSLAAGALVVKFPGFDEDNDEDEEEDEEDEEGEEDEEDDISLVSVLYGVGTYGNPDLNFTLGLGYGMVGTDIADKPLVVLGGYKRISRRTAFITENWIIPEMEGAIISYGIRFFGEQLSVDLALLNAIPEGIFPGIPYVDFVYNFGTKR